MPNIQPAEAVNHFNTDLIIVYDLFEPAQFIFKCLNGFHGSKKGHTALRRITAEEHHNRELRGEEGRLHT